MPSFSIVCIDKSTEAPLISPLSSNCWSWGKATVTLTASIFVSEIALETGQSIIEGIYDVGEYKIIDGAAVAQTVSIWDTVRGQRNALLSESDWTQISDSPLSDSKKTEWATYRQTLRDIPTAQSTVTDIDNITWPSEPS